MHFCLLHDQCGKGALQGVDEGMAEAMQEALQQRWQDLPHALQAPSVAGFAGKQQAASGIVADAAHVRIPHCLCAARSLIALSRVHHTCVCF